MLFLGSDLYLFEFLFIVIILGCRFLGDFSDDMPQEED
jgi:hypothetical protein